MALSESVLERLRQVSKFSDREELLDARDDRLDVLEGDLAFLEKLDGVGHLLRKQQLRGAQKIGDLADLHGSVVEPFGEVVDLVDVLPEIQAGEEVPHTLALHDRIAIEPEELLDGHRADLDGVDHFVDAFVPEVVVIGEELLEIVEARGDLLVRRLCRSGHRSGARSDVGRGLLDLGAHLRRGAPHESNRRGRGFLDRRERGRDVGLGGAHRASKGRERGGDSAGGRVDGRRGGLHDGRDVAEVALHFDRAALDLVHLPEEVLPVGAHHFFPRPVPAMPPMASDTSTALASTVAMSERRGSKIPWSPSLRRPARSFRSSSATPTCCKPPITAASSAATLFSASVSSSSLCFVTPAPSPYLASRSVSSWRLLRSWRTPSACFSALPAAPSLAVVSSLTRVVVREISSPLAWKT